MGRAAHTPPTLVSTPKRDARRAGMTDGYVVAQVEYTLTRHESEFLKLLLGAKDEISSGPRHGQIRRHSPCRL